MTLLSNKAFISQLDLMLDRNFERSFGVSVGFLLVRYPVIDSAQITTARPVMRGLTITRAFALGNEVSLVSVLTGVRIKRVNLEKEFMSFSSRRT